MTLVSEEIQICNAEQHKPLGASGRWHHEDVERYPGPVFIDGKFRYIHDRNYCPHCGSIFK